MEDANNRDDANSGRHKKVRTDYENGNEVIKLKVGGVRFQAERHHLGRYPNSFLATMLREGNRGMLVLDEEGYVNIDRDGRAFIYILRYYATGDINRAIAEVQGSSMMEGKKADNATSQTTTPFLDPITWAALESDLDFYFPGQHTPSIQVPGWAAARKSRQLLTRNIRDDEKPFCGRIIYFDIVCGEVLECFVKVFEDAVGRAFLFSIVKDTTIKLSRMLINVGVLDPESWAERVLFGVDHLPKYRPCITIDGHDPEDLIVTFLPKYSCITIDGNEFPPEKENTWTGRSRNVKFTLRDVFFVLSSNFSVHHMLANMIGTHLSAMLSKQVEVHWSSPCVVKEEQEIPLCGNPLRPKTDCRSDDNIPPMDMMELDLTVKVRQH